MQNGWQILLARGKFLPESNLILPGFTYSACGPFTEHRELTKKFKETSDLNYFYGNELNKAWFAHDTAYSDSKDFAKTTISDMILRDMAY